jgi:hypothetical protein
VESPTTGVTTGVHARTGVLELLAPRAGVGVHAREAFTTLLI